MIRPFVPEDITDEYLGWLNDRQLMKYSRQRLVTHTRESSEEYLRSFALSPNYFWNIVRREDDLQVGTMTAYVDPASATADVGLMIGHPRCGYGSEAFGAALAFLFEYLAGPAVRKVTAGTLKANRAMVDIAFHWRMRLEGSDEPGAAYRFGILRQEWMALERRGLIVVETQPSESPSSRG